MLDQILVPEIALALRLIGAAFLGAVIGLEREVHEHPAGMRTHLLVSVGAAGFTLLSIGAFSAGGGDPARVAAQIVTGVGFLGAGAILKEGATVRGLTTAASLWAVAAVGMAIGAGAWMIGVALTAIVVLSLWPLRLATDRFVGRDEHRTRLRLATHAPDALGSVIAVVDSHDGSIARLATERAPGGSLTVEIEFRAPSSTAGAAMVAAIAELVAIDVVESAALGD
jgi:putative Mg2+ transporter-C (MgtC) family protein